MFELRRNIGTHDNERAILLRNYEKRTRICIFFYYVPSVIRARGDVLFEYSCS